MGEQRGKRRERESFSLPEFSPCHDSGRVYMTVQTGWPGGGGTSRQMNGPLQPAIMNLGMGCQWALSGSALTLTRNQITWSGPHLHVGSLEVYLQCGEGRLEIMGPRSLREVQRWVWICCLDDHGTSSILGPLLALTHAFIKFIPERQDEGLSGCLLGEIFLSAWSRSLGHQALQSGHTGAWKQKLIMVSPGVTYLHSPPHTPLSFPFLFLKSPKKFKKAIFWVKFSNYLLNQLTFSSIYPM